MLLACGLCWPCALPAVAAPTWSAPLALGRRRTPSPFKPSVAIADGGLGDRGMERDRRGQERHPRRRSTRRRRVDDAPGRALEQPARRRCTPFASIDPAGNALVVWTQWAGPGCGVGNQTILFATRAAGAAAWSAPRRRSAPGATRRLADGRRVRTPPGRWSVAWETMDAHEQVRLRRGRQPDRAGSRRRKLLTSPPRHRSLYYLTAAIGDER